MKRQRNGNRGTVRKEKGQRKYWFLFSLIYVFLFLNLGSLFAQGNVINVDDAWIQQNLSEGALFFNAAGATYVFQTDFTAEGIAVFITADNITVDLNGHTIIFGTSDRNGTIGIYPFRQRSASKLGSDDVNYSRTAQGGSGGRNTLIKNGKVIWGGKNGTWAAAIGGMYAQSPLTIQNMYLESGGRDGACVHASWANIIIHDSYLVNKSTSTENRHEGPATIKGSGKIVAYNNIVIGGNSAIVCGPNSEIYNNLLRHSSFATNGYGVWLYRNSGVSIYNNLILPTNGRGILFNAGSNHVARDNLIVVHELPNQEYGERLNPPAFRIRYDADNNKFYNNKCLAIAGGENTAGSGAYLSIHGGMHNYIYDNEFRAILTSPPNDIEYANAITFEEQGKIDNFAQDVIKNNIFASNNYILRLAGYDGGCYQEAIENNTLKWIDGNETYDWFVKAIDASQYNFPLDPNNTYVTPQVLQDLKNEIKAEVQRLISGQPNNRERSTFFTGYYVYDAFITLMDTKHAADVGLDVADVYVQTAEGSENNILIGHSLYVKALDANGNPIPNRPVYVKDNTGNTFTGQTNNSGVARLELIDYALVKARNASTVRKETRSDHQATIAGLGTVSLPTDITDNASNPYELHFSGTIDVGAIPPAIPKGLRISK